jgi:hypothetical protein
MRRAAFADQFGLQPPGLPGRFDGVTAKQLIEPM